MTERARSLERFNLSIPGIFAERGVHEATEDNAFGLKGGTTWFTASDWSWSITSPFLVNYPAPSENSEAWLSAYWSIGEWVTQSIYGGAPPVGLQGGPPGINQDMITTVVESDDETQHQWLDGQIQILKDTSETTH